MDCTSRRIITRECSFLYQHLTTWLSTEVFVEKCLQMGYQQSCKQYPQVVLKLYTKIIHISNLITMPFNNFMHNSVDNCCRYLYSNINEGLAFKSSPDLFPCS